MLSSLGNLPIEDDIELYIFVVNGNWRGGLYDIIEKNFANIAQRIGPKAVIAKGFDSEIWSSQVAHKYFGEYYSELVNALPALFLTDTHPDKLNNDSLRLIIPLRDVETRFGDWDIFFSSLASFAIDKNPEFLEKFKNANDLITEGNKVIDIKPNFFGIGININALIKKFRE
jgi:hypothetical protein